MTGRWYVDPSTRNRNPKRSATAESPERKETLDRLVEQIEAQPGSGEKRQRGDAMRAARAAARNVVQELSGACRGGYRPPTTDALMEAHGRPLPASAQSALREFIAEVGPVLEAGEYGAADEAARSFGLDIGAEMAESGWRREPKGGDAPGESPTELAAQVGR